MAKNRRAVFWGVGVAGSPKSSVDLAAAQPGMMVYLIM